MDPFDLSGRRLDDKYDVERAVARGGFGVVYRAEHRALRKAVAIKVLVLHEALGGAARGEFLRCFEREAQTVAQLRHPAVVPALDFGASTMPSGTTAPWMVMEWVEGRTLAEELKERRAQRPRGPAECLALLRSVFEALAEAHEMGVAHRDIKPANIMLTPPTADGARGMARARRHGAAARILDFGIAKLMEPDEVSGTGDSQTRSTYAAFTLPYASPEQVGGNRTGPWTDVHALALVLTEVLTHCRPYPGETSTEVSASVFATLRPTPARFGVDVGPWEPVLARALALNPAARFADAAEFLAALEARVPNAQDLLPTTAVDPTVPVAAPRRAPRRVAVAAGATLTLAAGALRLLLAHRADAPAVGPVALAARAPSPAADPRKVAPVTDPTPARDERLPDARTLVDEAALSQRPTADAGLRSTPPLRPRRLAREPDSNILVPVE